MVMYSYLHVHVHVHVVHDFLSRRLEEERAAQDGLPIAGVIERGVVIERHDLVLEVTNRPRLGVLSPKGTDA